MSCGPSSRYVVGYYPTWKRSSLMNVDMSKISHLQVAFGIPTDSGDFAFDGDWFLPNLVREARREMTKITVSIGGWTGSNRLSTIMRDTHKRAALIKSIGTFVEKYELDGIDFDWEYPGRQGSKCNKFYPAEDSGNLLRFLRALRASFHARFPDDQKLISLAVRVQPFDNEGGPMKDVSAFAEYVDFASIMAFDINGVWSNTTGPNAPLDHQRNRGLPYSLSQAVDEWLDAKWPADKLVAGVAFYGRSLTTHGVMTPKEGANMYAPFVKEVPQGDNEDAMWYDVCENVNSMSGVWHYKHLRDQGILKTANTTTDDWVRVWDEKTSTPWLYNPQTRRFISYDDPESLGKKVEYVRKKGLKGMMTWSLHGDYNGELINVL
ncbi:endochitinase, partial [Martensiomyces pterosporus]